MQAIQSTADIIMGDKLNASSIPTAFHSKVKGFIKTDKHIDEKGAFDKEGFAATVDAEIKDWDKGFESSVAGFSASDEDDTEALANVAADETVDRMLGHCGAGKEA